MKYDTQLREVYYKFREGNFGDRFPGVLIANAYSYACSHTLITDSIYLKDADELLKDFSEENQIFNDYFESMNLSELVSFVMDGLSIYNREAMGHDCYALKTICDLSCRLLDLQDGDRVCDFGSGVGYFLANIALNSKDKKIDLYGIEKDKDDVVLSEMFLSLLPGTNSAIECSDIMDCTPGNYDKGFTFLEFGKRMIVGLDKIPSKVDSSVLLSRRNHAEWFFIDNMLSGLKEGGKALAIVSLGSLSYSGDQSYRNALLEKGLIEAIIELPEKIFSQFGIKTCLMLFSYGNEKVRMVDASDCFIKPKGERRNWLNDLDVEKIYENYESAEFEPKENLLNSDNLIPSIFLRKVEKPENAVMLKEVAEVSLGCQYTSTKFKIAENGEKTGYKIITPKEINDGIIDWDNLQSVHYDGTKFDKYALRKGDIVMTSKTSKIKFAVVDREPEEKILVTGGMTFIRPNLEKINPYMIQIYFDSPDGRNALAKIQKGNVVVTIIPKNLEEVYIPLPSMEEQERITSPYKEMISKLAFYNKEIFRIKKEIESYDYKKTK